MGNKLKILKGDGFSEEVIEVGYNPTEYSLKKSNSFNEVKVPGLYSPVIQYNNGETGTLDFELMLDTYISDSAKKESVKEKYIDKLEALLGIDSEKHAPPPCKVLWGELAFEGVLASMDKKYILFDKDGKPLRARVTLSFKQLISLEKQSKGAPPYSPDRRKLFQIKEGESLWQLAHIAYGDPARWRVIAQANKIDNPTNLQAGRELIIPVLKG